MTRSNFNASDFAEDTELERFALGRLGTHRVRPASPGATHDIRPREKGGAQTVIAIGSIVSGASLRDELRNSLRPLAFGFAYKIVDMLVEHVLRANGATAPRLTFAEKARSLSRRPRRLPPPLDQRPELWDRLGKLYIALEEGRHAVTHRRAQASADGGLEIYDGTRGLSDTITSAELEAFAAAAHAVAELVIDGSYDERRLGLAAWYLNALSGRHGLAALPGVDPNAGRRVLVDELDELDGGLLRFDVARAKAAVEFQPPSVWDLRLLAGKRVFVGRWEDVPDPSAGSFDFHPASPPAWLSEELPPM